MENPAAVDRPVLSWKTLSGKEGFVQTAYRLEVASSGEKLAGKADVWCSGDVPSDAQFGIGVPAGGMTPGTEYFWRVRVRDQNGRWSRWSEPARFRLGPAAAGWNAEWITADWDVCAAAPFFRKEFRISDSGRLVSAVVCLCGLGCSDLYLNGKPVDPGRMLDPAQTNYEHYAFYSAFDVRELMRSGDNTVGVLLGDGWYNQDLVWNGFFSYGRPMLTLRMELRYEDGTVETIGSDRTWEWTESPLVKSNIYAGETYDARRRASFLRKMERREGWNRAVRASGIVPKALYPQPVEPIRVQRVYPALSVRRDPAGNWIFDFGVNIAGIPRIRVSQPEGTRLRMRMGETLKPDGSIDFSTTGVAATGTVQTDEYVCAGDGAEEWSPRFTYHGFRYLELSGAVTEPDTSWVRAVSVRSDVRPAGYFRCSDETMNRLHEMAVRTLAGNLHGLPSDCPHRERCGWLGDAHTIAPYANFNFGMYDFWMKYLEDIRSTASSFAAGELHHKASNAEFYHADKQPGIPYMIAPGRRLCGVASPDWGTALVQLPWQLYLHYGSREPLERYYDWMKQWVEYVGSLGADCIIPFGLGDWCPPGGNAKIDCPIALSSTAFHYIDVSIVRQAAEALGRRADSERFGELGRRIRDAFNERFFDPQSGYGSHTANALALDAGLVPEGFEKLVSDAVVRDAESRYGGFIHAGIFGIGRIPAALSRYGNAAAVCRIFAKEGENSFPFMWRNADATTLWEVLPVSSESRDECLAAGCSLNHPMQGGYDAWFYEDVAGIRPDPQHPGFKRVLFEPRMTGCLQWAEGRVDTPYGEVRSCWKRDAQGLEWRIAIPANASGRVVLPLRGEVSVNGEGIAECRGVVPVAGTDGTYLFQAGDYVITVSGESRATGAVR